MGGDITAILIWWTHILLLGLIFFPAAEIIFGHFFDKGYLFSKVIGVSLTAYAVWLMSSLRILPFGRTSIFGTIIFLFVIIYVYFKGYKKLFILCRENSKTFIAEELLFLAGLIFWCYIRGLKPDIYGLEKYMDFGFINSILRSRYMPPADMWFGGQSINYYYFGHYICAFLSSLTDIESAVSYNIMIAVIFSLALSLSFSLGANAIHMLGDRRLKAAIAAGVISSLLVAFGGNLHAFIYAKALPFAKQIGLYDGEVKNYFYADATRYIGYNPPTEDKTIHEFPLYSFVVSDLHGHVSDIPFVITFIAMILAYISGGFNGKRVRYVFGFMLIILYMTNGWDYPIYLIVTFFAVFYKKLEGNGLNKKTLEDSILEIVKIFAVSQLLGLFYILNFKNMTGGIGVVHSRTPMYQLMVLWGYQFFLILCYAAFLLLVRKREDLHFTKSDAFIIILLVSALGLVAGPEMLYVKDIYGHEYHRANTMFKLTYQAFIMFGISGGYIVVRIVSSLTKKWQSAVSRIVFILVLIMPMIYPFYAIKGYYESVKSSNYKGLDGQSFLENTYPGDYEAIRWLNKNVKGQLVVLEADGDSYTDYCRISMATGLPTVQGWLAHEWLWRGGPEEPYERSEDVAVIYESDDVEETMRLIMKYDIYYIIIGRLEKDRFRNINLDKLMNLGYVVFDYKDTKIIQIQSTLIK